MRLDSPNLARAFFGALLFFLLRAFSALILPQLRRNRICSDNKLWSEDMTKTVLEYVAAHRHDAAIAAFFVALLLALFVSP
jgi:hypothetical protein